MFDLANEPKQAFWAKTPDHNEMDLVPGYIGALQSFAATLEKTRPAQLPGIPSPRVP
jgi:hypothetical protein